MHPLERDILETIRRYEMVRQEVPKSLSISYHLWNELLSTPITAATYFWDGTKPYTGYYSFHGLPVKLVKRKNYIEAMPRRKRSKYRRKIKATFYDGIQQMV